MEVNTYSSKRSVPRPKTDPEKRPIHVTLSLTREALACLDAVATASYDGNRSAAVADLAQRASANKRGRAKA